MTLSYAYKCDICGAVARIPIDGNPKDLPTGWSSLTIHYSGGTGQQKHACAWCSQILQDDKCIIEERIADQMRAPPLPYDAEYSASTFRIGGDRAQEARL